MHPARLDAGAFTPAVFSARRPPDRNHYRIVRCVACGLLRSDPVARDDVLSGLYTQSEFRYGDETANLGATYGRYLGRLERFAGRRDALLEIGCGNGFFLAEARRRGYAEARGVEPSRDAVAKAPPALREAIVVDVMRPGLFDQDSFDAVCLFQVLDHLADPAGVLRECFRLLRPGGLVLCLNHDVGALSARILGSRSPIVDVEHTYLFDRRTISILLRAQGYDVLETGPVRNAYSLRYLVHLLPLPRLARTALAAVTERTQLGGLRLAVRLGNLYAIARRPGDPAT